MSAAPPEEGIKSKPPEEEVKVKEEVKEESINAITEEEPSPYVRLSQAEPFQCPVCDWTGPMRHYAAHLCASHPNFFRMMGFSEANVAPEVLEEEQRYAFRCSYCGHHGPRATFNCCVTCFVGASPASDEDDEMDEEDEDESEDEDEGEDEDRPAITVDLPEQPDDAQPPESDSASEN